MHARSGAVSLALESLPLPLWAPSAWALLLPIYAACVLALCRRSSPATRVALGPLACCLAVATGGLLSSAARGAARAAVLRVLADGLDGGLPDEGLRDAILEVRRRWGVAGPGGAGAAFEEAALAGVYERLLAALAEGPGATPRDARRLARLRHVLDLDWIDVGLAHRHVAEALAAQGRARAEHAIGTLLFLSESVFGAEVPEEAGRLDLAQVRKALRLSPAEARRRVAAVSRALYRQGLSTAVAETGGADAGAELGGAEPLGLTGDEAEKLKADAYKQVAAGLLSEGRLSEEGRRALQRTQEALNLADAAASAAFLAVAGPVLRERAQRSAEGLGEGCEGEELARRAASLRAARDDLGVPAAEAKAIVAQAFAASLRLLYRASAEARSRGEEAALAAADRLARAALAAGQILQELGPDSAGAPALNVGADVSSASRLYGLCLNRLVRGEAPPGSPAPETLSSLLGLSPAEEEAVRVRVCLPLLRARWSEALTEASGGVELSSERPTLAVLLERLRLPERAVQEAASEAYAEQLAPLSGRIPSAAEKEGLDAAREILEPSPADAARLHLRAFGSVYTNAVQEAFGRRGVMTPEASAALQRLRERLAIAEEDAERIFHGVASARVAGMMEGVRAAWEEATYSKDALAKLRRQRGQDVGEDPSADGTGELGIQGASPQEGVRGLALMARLTELADFCTRNGLVREGAAAQEAYPVTVGTAIGDTTKEEMFGIYAWNAVTCQDAASKERWTEAKPHVGGILGLTPDRQQKVMVRMVSRWAKTYIKQQTRPDGELEERALSTLTTWVPAFFGVDPEVTKGLVEAANKANLQSRAMRLLNTKAVSPDDLARLRDAVEAANLSMHADLDLSKQQLRSLFRVEVVASLQDSGLRNEDKVDAIISSKESFGVSDEEADEEIRSLARQRVDACLMNAVGDLAQGKEAAAVGEMRRLHSLAAFAEHIGILPAVMERSDWIIPKPIRERLVKTYSASVAGQAEAAEDIAMLRSVLGIATSSSAAA